MPMSSAKNDCDISNLPNRSKKGREDLMTKKSYRDEHDSMGTLKVPIEALWGAQTQRAVDNFPL